MKTTSWPIMGAGILAICILGAAQAEPYSLDFSGELSDDFGTLSAGTPIQGIIVYDPSQPPWQTCIYSIGYFSISSGSGHAFAVPGTDTYSVFLHIYDDAAPESPYSSAGSDAVWARANPAQTHGSLGGLDVHRMNFLLIDSSGDALSDLSAPTTLELSWFDTATFFIQHEVAGIPSTTATGILTSLSLTPGYVYVVPAPSAVLLGTLGAALVSWLRKRRTL